MGYFIEALAKQFYYYEPEVRLSIERLLRRIPIAIGMYVR